MENDNRTMGIGRTENNSALVWFWTHHLWNRSLKTAHCQRVFYLHLWIIWCPGVLGF